MHHRTGNSHFHGEFRLYRHVRHTQAHKRHTTDRCHCHATHQRDALTSTRRGGYGGNDCAKPAKCTGTRQPFDLSLLLRLRINKMHLPNILLSVLLFSLQTIRGQQSADESDVSNSDENKPKVLIEKNCKSVSFCE